jgi:hypothetical protein
MPRHTSVAWRFNRVILDIAFASLPGPLDVQRAPFNRNAWAHTGISPLNLSQGEDGSENKNTGNRQLKALYNYPIGIEA